MSIHDDIEKLISYNWDIECDSYCEEFGLEEGQDPVEHALAHPENNHIFCILARLHVEHKPVVEKPLLASSGNSDAISDVLTDMFKGTQVLYYPIEAEENNCHVEVRFKNHESFLDAVEMIENEPNYVCWSETENTLIVGLKIENYGCPDCGGVDVEKHEKSYTTGEIQESGKIRLFCSDIETCETTCSRCGASLDDFEEVEDDK